MAFINIGEYGKDPSYVDLDSIESVLEPGMANVPVPEGYNSVVVMKTGRVYISTRNVETILVQMRNRLAERHGLTEFIEEEVEDNGQG